MKKFAEGLGLVLAIMTTIFIVVAVIAIPIALVAKIVNGIFGF